MTIEQKKNKSNIDVIASVSEAIPYKKEIATAFSKPRNDAWRKTAFTLAEVLIVISVIGIVAAMTIPTLIHNINAKEKEKKIEVFYQRLAFGMRDMAVKSSLSGYKDGYEFVKALSKQYKVFGVFNTSEIPKGYQIAEAIIDDDGNTVKISSITTPKSLTLSDDETHTWSNPVAFISTDGTPVIFSYNTKCSLTEADINGKATTGTKSGNYKEITQCIAGVYDINGLKAPNKMGTDIMSLNGGKLKKGCSGTDISGIGCVDTSFVGSSYSAVNCSDSSSEDYKYCGTPSGYTDDYWAGAKKLCASQDMSLPTIDQLQTLYKHKSELGISSGWVWSSSEFNSYNAYGVGFLSGGTYDRTKYDGGYVLCIGN